MAAVDLALWDVKGKHFGVPVIFRAIDVSHALRKSVFGRLIRLAERSVYRHSDWISANNVALRDYCIEEGADPDRISVEYPGIDFERFHPQRKNTRLLERYGLNAEDRVVLYMGTFYRFAGLDWFLELFAQVLEARRDVKVVLVGSGEHESQLRLLVVRLGLEESVIFTGFVPYEELADHVRLGDVAVAPFVRQLATDNALVAKVFQYVACGVPTVCTPMPGTMGLLGEGEGVLYRDRGSEFVDVVVDLLDDPSRSTQLGSSGRAALMERCDWQRFVDRVEELIESVAVDR